MIFINTKYTLRILIIILISLVLSSCEQNVNRQNRAIKHKSKKESLEKVNRYMVNTEEREIQNYVKRHNLNVIKTGSGVLYEITKHGNGKKVEEGKIITIDYKMKLITGDVVYSSKEEGPLIFKIGRGGVESGLEEVILNLRDGDEAIIIIPSHLAYGFLGDRKKIPGRSTIIYELKITNLK